MSTTDQPAARLEGASEATFRSLIGRKISVRYRLHDDPEHPHSEAVGMVASVGDGVVSVVNRRGEMSVFAIDDVIAGKAWPISE
jgi:hypothetical protein